MNILGNNASKLNDVIFENRNKNYGAYSIRESYNDSLIKSLFYLSSLIVLLFATTFIYNKINGVASDDKKIMLPDVISCPMFEVPVNLTPLEVIQNKAAASTAPAGSVGTRVIDNAPETNTVNLNSSLTGVGSSTATGTDPTGPETSTVLTTPAVSTIHIVSSEPVIIADEMPEFEGGVDGLMKYIGKNISYPENAKEAGIYGTVYVSFVVNELGNVENARVMRGIGHGCDEEVLRVVGKMPRWKKVGKNAGHPVKVKYNIPVSFKLR